MSARRNPTGSVKGKKAATTGKAVDKARETLQQSTQQAVRGWLWHPSVRPAVESLNWREGVGAALEPLEASVGRLDQFGIYWLVLRALGKEAWPPEGAPYADTYRPPAWANHPEVPAAAERLLYVVTALATELNRNGVDKLDPLSVADLVVLAQLVDLSPWNWNDPDEMIANLNVASIGSVDDDGHGTTGTTPDRHAGERDERALNTLRRSRQPEGRIRAPYPERPEIYDLALRGILAPRPNVTVSDIMKALDDGADWVSALAPFYKTRSDRAGHKDFRRTIERRLRQLKGPHSP